MDPAVALVRSYLLMNGYFAVTEYPILELAADGPRTVTDVDVLAVRFPGAGRADPDRPTRGVIVDCDPALDVPEDRIDLIIAEVKEGRADLNRAARDPAVLRAALRRFGGADDATFDDLVAQLLDDGEAVHPAGIRVRLLAFGSQPPSREAVRYRWLSHAHLAWWMRRVLTERWPQAQAVQSKDPALAFLLLLEKAARGG